jgi:hypothetical protein
MNQHRISAGPCSKKEQQKAKRHVLRKIRVDSHRAEHPGIARIADRDPEAATHAQRSDAEPDKHQSENRGIDRR